MDIFQPVRFTFGILGVEPLQPVEPPKNRSIRAYSKSVLVLCVGVSCCTSLILFLLFDAATFQDYTEALYILSSILMSQSNFVILLVNAKNCFKIMDDFKNVLQTREYILVSAQLFG